MWRLPNASFAIMCMIFIVNTIPSAGSTRPTREGMTSALNSMDRHDLGGYAVSYKPGVRSDARFVELTIIGATGKITALKTWQRASAGLKSQKAPVRVASRRSIMSPNRCPEMLSPM